MELLGKCAKLSNYQCHKGEMGEVNELVGPMIFLASEASSYVTSHSLFVDGE